MRTKTLALDGAWTLRHPLGGADVPAKVPGSVLADLLAAGLIEDPFWRENEYSALRLFDRDYCYETVFDAPAELLARRYVDLVFDGLDTLADVTLAGTTVLRADNMHRTWRVDVKKLLRPAGNALSVFLRSPNRFIAEAFAQNPDVTYDGSGSVHGTSFLRKAHCMFGWDWGPQLPDAGIWRSCRVEGYDARLSEVDIRQIHEAGRVTLRIAAKAQDGESVAALRVTVTDPDGRAQVFCADGGELAAPIDAPRLWMPNGWGAQPLYTVETALLDAQGDMLDAQTRRVGLRTMEVSRDQDQWGEEFCFRVNGRKLFAMGADYIPEDNILPRLSRARTEKLLRQCCDAHFNCLRVWGGGCYPEDWFYDLCDELGLIVWQDLMYACNVYKMTDAFEENIVAETRDNLLRIRDHACLGLICGNNEMESGWVDWPAVTVLSPALKADYIKQFEYVLRKAVGRWAPHLYYWPSSPSSGGCFDDPGSYDRGDVHCWDIWHGMRPFEDYLVKYPRFCSEFGFESFPDMKTIRAFALPEDMRLNSRVMESHQKCVGGNAKIMTYLSQNYRQPQSFEETVYASQLQQAEAMRTGVEHWRRNRGRCMGAIYWQLNDCWPVASWASIDSLGRWKALHYAAKKFFAPVLASCERQGWIVRPSVVNDTLEDFVGVLRLTVLDVRNGVKDAEEVPVRVPALSALWLPEDDLSRFAEAGALHPEDNLALILSLRDARGGVLSENCELLSRPKFMATRHPTFALDFSDRGDDCVLTVTSDVFAWGVRLDLGACEAIPEDNYFYLLPGVSRVLLIPGVHASDLRAGLTISALGNP